MKINFREKEYELKLSFGGWIRLEDEGINVNKIDSLLVEKPMKSLEAIIFNSLPRELRASIDREDFREEFDLRKIDKTTVTDLMVASLPKVKEKGGKSKGAGKKLK